MSGETTDVIGLEQLPGRPLRCLDTVNEEGLEDLVDADCIQRSLVKSRDFPELHGSRVQASDIAVVLFDAKSLDSFAACMAARLALGDACRFEGVDRSTATENLSVDISNQIVAMLGVCWSLEAMHDLVTECECLIILETHTSAARELEQFNYPNAVRILEPGMGAGALAWNFFFPGEKVPPLLRALEDAELGRTVLRDAEAFADGCHVAFDIEPPHGELNSDDPAFEHFELLMDSGGRATIARAVQEGLELRTEIQGECSEAIARCHVRTPRKFPTWRCVLVELSSPFAGRVGEYLVSCYAAYHGQAERPYVAVVFERRRWHVRAVLRSLPGGPDVSEIAQEYGGSGHPNRAFFTISRDMWEGLWLPVEAVLWDTISNNPQCLNAKRGDSITIVRRGERFKDSPCDEWSWGYKTGDGDAEGWIPTLAHTLFVATRSVPAVCAGILAIEEGDLLVARGQKGRYLWGSTFRLGRGTTNGLKGWFPYIDGTWQPVHPRSARDFIATGGGM